ncbi:hypothetical protein [Plantibacter sp. YIM 135249]|uniref:hypothetical protein n=1 Tax=Plantibacter sp. YIM 135249 TaxID=3423918 RepID=UPI003D33A02E
MNNRKLIAAELHKAGLPKRYKIVDNPRSIDALERGRPVVQLIQTTVSHAPNAQGSYLCKFAIWVIEPKLIDPEDDLDAALAEVITALDQLAFLSWETAERSTYGGGPETTGNPAYRIDATVIATKE